MAGPCNIHSLALSRHINAVIESGGGSPVTFTAPVVIDGIANTVKMTVNVHSYV